MPAWVQSFSDPATMPRACGGSSPSSRSLSSRGQSGRVGGFAEQHQGRHPGERSTDKSRPVPVYRPAQRLRAAATRTARVKDRLRDRTSGGHHFTDRLVDEAFAQMDIGPVLQPGPIEVVSSGCSPMPRYKPTASLASCIRLPSGTASRWFRSRQTPLRSAPSEPS